MPGVTQNWGAASEMEDISGQIAIVVVREADHSKASGRTSTGQMASAMMLRRDA